MRALVLDYIIINRVYWVVSTVNNFEELGFWTL